MPSYDEHRPTVNKSQGIFSDCFKKSRDLMSSPSNPRFDYSYNFMKTGEHPQNFVLNDAYHERYRHYPKMDSFMMKKRQHVEATNHPAMSLRCNPLMLSAVDLKSHFDAILIEPPLVFEQGSVTSCNEYYNWDEIEQIPVEQLAAPRSFIWLWCGSIEGLTKGRECLKKWGFRRCEDICWIKTNKIYQENLSALEPDAIFHRTKEHCLMGIKGTVKRSIDGDFIHANVDVDVILADQDPDQPDRKPNELFNIIENFCLGRRRLHLYGRNHSVRPGWLTVGPNLAISNFNADDYSAYFNHSVNGHLTGSTAEIENMRPKSPPPKESKQIPSGGTGVNADNHNKANGVLPMNTGTVSSVNNFPTQALLQQPVPHLFQQPPCIAFLFPHQNNNLAKQQHFPSMIKQPLTSIAQQQLMNSMAQHQQLQSWQPAINHVNDFNQMNTVQHNSEGNIPGDEEYARGNS